ncbi:MAG: hypothetical protein QM504_06820 [Pseudomonadota bacterium]
MSIERVINIKFNWWRSDDKEETIPSETLEQLEEHAEERISKMREDGFTSGELCFESDESTSYSGWWSFSYA